VERARTILLDVRTRRGFTLVEMLAVILIVGLLMSSVTA
jgi:prepilin-type N-terminal cleavage/methylation domain-containing protein